VTDRQDVAIGVARGESRKMTQLWPLEVDDGAGVAWQRFGFQRLPVVTAGVSTPVKNIIDANW
jgi:hypothetical protein